MIVALIYDTRIIIILSQNKNKYQMHNEKTMFSVRNTLVTLLKLFPTVILSFWYSHKDWHATRVSLTIKLHDYN